MAMGLGAAERRLAARRGSADPQACDFARRGTPGGHASSFVDHWLGARRPSPVLNRRAYMSAAQRESAKSPFVFVSERGAPLSAPGFSRMIERAAIEADLGIKAHAHMLRHACGFKLANDGVDTRSLQAYWRIAISRIRPGTRRWRRIASRGSGWIRLAHFIRIRP
jgi:integrase